ncbi:transketolase, partial [Bartonella sp. M0193]
MKNNDKQNQMANAIRFLSIDAIEKANSGHPGLPMGAADIATVLYTKFLAHDPKKPNWPNRDRFVLSAGHGSMLLYSVMYLSGYEDVTIDEIKNFRQLGAKTAGHPEYRHINGIETTTGPLGQGIANAVGMALGERIMNARWGDLIDHYTYVLAGDGCLMEGISQEAIAFAGHMKLNKLIVFWDNNQISIDGAITISDNTDQCARFEACQWNTIKVDGHDQDAIAKAIEKAKTSDKPTLISCRTTIGFGSPHKAGTNKAHGSPLGKEEVAETRKSLGWESEPFVIPAEILDNWRLAGLNAAKKRQEWDKKLEALDPQKRAEFERLMRGDLPGNFDSVINDYKKKL